MEGIEQLRQAVDALGELDPATLSDDELGQTLVECQRIRARFAAVEARLTAAFERRGAWRIDGSKTAAAWLARRCGASPQAMRAQTRRLWRRVTSPRPTPGVLAGLYGSPRKPVADAFADAEQQLVGYARDLGFDEFTVALRYWETAVDPDGAGEQAAADHEARHLRLSQTFRGAWALDGLLDPVSGEQVHTALRRIERELFEQDWAQAKAEHGPDTCLDHLPRCPTQRRADALVEMARRAVAVPAGARLPRPLVVAHLGDDTLRRLCELASGTVIAPGRLVPLLAQADIERIVYAGASRRVVDLGRRTRFFTGGLRRAIQLRDRRCQHPGCRTPAEDCDVDHVTPYAKGGPTNQTNGTLLCPRHNAHKAGSTPDPRARDTS